MQSRPYPLLIVLILATSVARFDSPCQAAEGELDTYGGNLSISGKTTGWFHLQQQNGRWFFITPTGNAFFSLGASHAVDCIRQDELNLFASKFRSQEEELGAFILQRFSEWGYNSAGYGALESMQDKIPYIATIRTQGPRSLSAGAKSQYHDLFDPQFQKSLEQMVIQSANPHIDNRHCLGYVFIDLPIWSASQVGRSGGQTYADYFRSLAPATPGKVGYLTFLSSRYQGKTDDLKQVYQLDLRDLAPASTVDLSHISAATNKQIATDDEAFLNQVADVYYQLITTALRRVDTNHLICGDRLMALAERTPDSILQTAARYVDVLAFQPMGTREMLQSYITHAGRLTGKPVLLADVNTMSRRPEKNELDTTEYERSSGEHTLAYYLDAASSPYCIGIHRCTIRDYQPWNTQYHRRGLLKADDTPYPILIDYTVRTNRQVYNLVYGQQQPTKSKTLP